MQTFRVELGARAYPVRIGSGLLDQLGALACEAGLRTGRAAIVTDSNVAPLYGQRALDALTAAGFDPVMIEIGAGEASKSLPVLATIYDRLVEAEIDRSGAIFALGGGVVGDLAGFAAATYLRGIALVQVPTTLVAQVDSSLGGKTGVNHRLAKNLIGAFYQPRLIAADVATLNTLGEREFREGLAEVIKYAAIMDTAMIDTLEAGMAAILGRDPAKLEAAVERSLRLKAFVIERDETESDLRRILNFGHTVGHALEAGSGYGNYLHGEAVAIGMVIAAQLSRHVAGLAESEAVRLTSLIAQAGLPVRMPSQWDRQKFVAALMLDKKRAGDSIEFVLLDRLGHALTHRLRPDDIMAHLARLGLASLEH